MRVQNTQSCYMLFFHKRLLLASCFCSASKLARVTDCLNSLQQKAALRAEQLSLQSLHLTWQL